MSDGRLCIYFMEIRLQHRDGGEAKRSEAARLVAPRCSMRKLYQWSKANPDDAWRDVWGWMTDLRTLRSAWRRVASNKGKRSAGVDGMTVGRIRLKVGEQRFLQGLQDELRSGAYRPSPSRRKLIPKAGKPGQFRPQDVIPAQFRVIVTHRPKYACRGCEKIVETAAPEHLIKSGLPTEAMVAHVLVAKYGWHLPFYRQAQMFLAQGIKLDRSTLAFWVGYAAAELLPLHERMRTILLGSAKLAVDETTVPVLDPGRGRTKTGFFWTMARDDRPWGGPDPPCVVYSYAPGRGSVHATTLLADYHGIVQCDGYRAYKKLNQNRIQLAFCWAHLRRQFNDIAKKGNAPLASEALVRIAEFYRIEEMVRGRSADERRAARQEKSKPQVMAFRDWLETQLSNVSAKSPIAEAIRYGLNHWDGLARFLDDGRIELDTNIVERSMRPVALTRKNALFAGHDDGAENWACIASLIETCKLNGIDPQAYLADVLVRLVNLWPNNRLDELLPWAWAVERQTMQRAA